MSETDNMVQALDPFVAAAYRQRQGVRPEVGRQAGPATHVLENYLPHVGQSLAQIPGNALRAAGDFQRGGDYDAAPVMDAAMLTMGAPGVPAGALGMGLKLKRSPYGHYITNDEGKIIGEVESSLDRKARAVDVNSLNAYAGPNSVGPSEMRSLLQALRNEYPEAEYVRGHRVTGARDKAGTTETTGHVKWPLPDPELSESSKALLQKHAEDFVKKFGDKYR